MTDAELLDIIENGRKPQASLPSPQTIEGEVEPRVEPQMIDDEKAA